MAERRAKLLRTEDGVRIFDLGEAGLPSFGVFTSLEKTKEEQSVAEGRARLIRIQDGTRIFDLGKAGLPSFGVFPRRKEKEQKQAC